MAMMTAALREAGNGEFHRTGAAQVDDSGGKPLQPVRWGSGAGRHSRQAPKGDEESARRGFGLATKFDVAFTAECPAPCGIPDAAGIEEALENFVLVDDRELQERREFPSQVRLAATWKAGYNHESSVSQLRHVLRDYWRSRPSGQSNCRLHSNLALNGAAGCRCDPSTR